MINKCKVNCYRKFSIVIKIITPKEKKVLDNKK